MATEKVHPVEKELCEALDIKRKSGEGVRHFHDRLHEAATKCDQKVWDQLSDPSQSWVNAITDFFDGNRKAYPKDYDDVEPDEKPKKGKNGDGGKSKQQEEDDERDDDRSEKSEEDDMATSKKGGSKAPAKKTTVKKSVNKASGEGYKGHRAGSNKEAVHKEYDQKGADAALKLAVKKGIKESSARSWIGSWGGFGKKK